MIVQILKRYWLLWATLGLLLAVAYLPARLALAVLPAELQLSGVTGTIWHGRAARAMVSLSGEVLMLGGLDWQLQPTSLLRFRPTAEVSAQWGGQQLDGEVGVDWRGELVLEDVAATMDIGWARRALPLFVEGRLRADVARAVIAGDGLKAVQGNIVWERAAWAARAGSLPLGTYVIELAGEEGRVVGDVSTLSGGMQATGRVALDGPDYEVSVRLEGPALNNEGLRQAMVLFAVPDGDAYAVDLRGRL